MNDATYYSYIFVKKGLIPAQVAIQSSHVSMKLGNSLGRIRWGGYPEHLNSENLHYVLTENFTTFAELKAILLSLGHSSETFSDYDYEWVDGVLVQSQEKSIKSLITYPIHEDNRGLLKGLPLWRVS